MTDVYIYSVNLPPQVSEVVTPTGDGYTVYVNARHTIEAQRQALEHARRHILSADFEREDVQKIEAEGH